MLNPLEVAKTRLQVISADSATNIEKIRRGFFSMLASVAKQEGLPGLYRGILPRLIVAVPGSAVSLVAYEFTKTMSLRTPKS